MPEEINRILTDHASDYLFTTEASGNNNLRREGICLSKVHFVGNVMIDSLVELLPLAKRRWEQAWVSFNSQCLDHYALVTLHRPSNVDASDTLREILRSIRRIACELPVVFPVHPRTRSRLEGLGSQELDGSLLLSDPLGYLDFMALMSRASLVVTDSGGIQEETSFLGIPCITVRENTERPITLTEGTNRLVTASEDVIVQAANDALSWPRKETDIPLWDGQAAVRIVEVLRSGSKNNYRGR
jgi:UDP-N-acetylglucosamine 2-epimerase (non-hydrolysing)